MKEYIVKADFITEGDELVMPDIVSELIRCKDCKHRVLINNVWRCLFSDFIAPEHYCGYAEQRGEE